MYLLGKLGKPLIIITTQFFSAATVPVGSLGLVLVGLALGLYKLGLGLGIDKKK